MISNSDNPKEALLKAICVIENVINSNILASTAYPKE